MADSVLVIKATVTVPIKHGDALDRARQIGAAETRLHDGLADLVDGGGTATVTQSRLMTAKAAAKAEAKAAGVAE